MTRFGKKFVVLACLCAVGLTASADEPSPWVSYESQIDRFAASFPTTPEIEVLSETGEPRRATYRSVSSDRLAHYRLTVHDLVGPDTGAAQEGLILGTSEAIRSELSGAILRKKMIRGPLDAIDEKSGTELTSSWKEANSDKTLYSLFRFLPVGSRCYELQVIFVGDSSWSDADKDRFFKSFRPSEPEVAVRGWRTVTPSGAGFSAQFPARPTVVSSRAGSSPYKAYTTTGPLNRGEFRISYFDLKQTPSTEQIPLIFDNVRNTYAKRFEATASNEKSVVIDGSPSRQFVLKGTFEDKPITVSACLVTTGSRFFEVKVVDRDQQRPVDAADIDRFLKSLKITGDLTPIEAAGDDDANLQVTAAPAPLEDRPALDDLKADDSTSLDGKPELDVPPDQWRWFRSEQGRFQVMLPQEPRLTTGSVNNCDRVCAHALSAQGAISFAVSSVDHDSPISQKDAVKIFNSTRDRSIKEFGAEIKHDQLIRYRSYLGRDLLLEADVDGRAYFFRERNVVVGDRSYILQMVWTADQPVHPPAANQFLNSLVPMQDVKRTASAQR
ncbi:hypothetical protein [Stratiformator vulcanicus]|uniref:Uncharacterized protein n=1 Tax=Stratiformator vulcanicus TaxID=2527980 RepID=A0A517QXW2_9PLAN|nr:hypothetical protein [Stratiformator vulcanicus]QDT36444.1 hypothetical protein Pan189_08000 [Stratiformator vulcanicus]